VQRVNSALWRLLACALAFLLSWPASAQITPDTLERAVALAAGAAAALAPPGARVQVEAGLLDARLTLAPCERVDPYLTKGVPAWGRTRIGLRCSAGAVRWSVFMPLTVHVWAPALVSTVALPAGARLSEAQLVLAEADWAATPQPPFGNAAALAGRTLARPVLAGQPLRASDLQPRVWFAIGDRVKVQATGNGFVIQAEGQALSPGLEGQTSRVRVGEEGSSRVVTGRAVASDRVEIGL
jgi:flagella basal body P-ring formation protein FlgA